MSFLEPSYAPKKTHPPVTIERSLSCTRVRIHVSARACQSKDVRGRDSAMPPVVVNF
jgi:hypothetical protein